MNPSDHFFPATTDEDLLPVVNERDEPLGVLPRRQVHLEGLRHRAVQVCVVDGQGRIWLQQRSRRKDSFPGYWDFGSTGHVDPGESYDEAARRELREELGLDAQPQFLTKVEASARTGWEFQGLYWLRWPGGLAEFNRDEIEQVRPFTAGELGRAIADPASPWPVTPCVVDHWPLFARALGLAKGAPDPAL